MILTYENAKSLITSQSKFYINLGLDRIKSVLNLFDNPQEKLKVIHIAGTNGKGSVSSVLANILNKAGYKTGLYTSPHLVEYTERIKIYGNDISKNDFANYIEKVCTISEKNKIDLTEFEILTVCAFLYFFDNKTDIVILETGLGGRFDATNVCSNPIISVITSISKDHTDRLGNKIEQIAYEKAGIIKPNSCVVIANNNQGFNTIKEVSASQNAKIFEVSQDIKTIYENGKNYAIINNQKYEFPLLGFYQQKNLALVLKTIEILKDKNYIISDSAIENGLKTVKWAGRLEYIPEKNLLIDGAHNPDAATELRKSLDYYFKGQKRIFIYSTLNTKDYKTIANILFTENDEIYFYEFEHKNAVKYEEYTKNIPTIKNIHKFNTVQINKIIKQDGIKIVTGSLYMIGYLYNDLIN